ncbi:NAD-dependent epimerase/dehydratase family protein [Arcticibacter eurypsychrophilus]|uniref:NAD-dependent epimerase/dehydratase family protein n=1 Tax=Arcticibacter eurypsychrophilus TaxID=1434752 RepID=UPI00084DB875|nr:NAD-dependent epimerase/dehydratase family protein [Arcticibacter eurypsychrophilus]
MKPKSIVVTGGSGFVGSNLIKKLNASGVNDIIIIDNYDERKFLNIKNCAFIDYISYKSNLQHIDEQLKGHNVGAVLHIGANADVLVKDAEVMLVNNYEHSKYYLNFCLERKIPLIYASSSAVYGNSTNCIVDNDYEHPHNVYSWSKWMFDKYVLNNMTTFESRVIGLRFFNIFGMGEAHKDKNASLPYRFHSFIKQKGFIDLFDKEIKRDYVWVEDVANVIVEILNDNSIVSGIHNLGSGNPISHRDLAQMVIDVLVQKGITTPNDHLIQSIPMPEDLISNFQFHTKAEDLMDVVKKYTSGNADKIKRYINDLIDQG